MTALDGVFLIVLNGELLFLSYPLVNRYLASESLVCQLFYSHVLSVSLMTLILWLSYLVGNLGLIQVVTTILILTGFIGISLFGARVFRRILQRPFSQYLSFDISVPIAIIIGTVTLSVVSAFTVPFRIEGDPYYFYVPIGRYLNEHPGNYFESFYRYFLSRDLGYYAMYAHADFLGKTLNSSEVYRFLPMPFVAGSLLGLLSLARKIIQDHSGALLATVVLALSVFCVLLVKYNQFYLGNVAMISLSLFLCHFLLDRSNWIFRTTVLAVSTFAISLLYDLAFLLTIPFTIAYLSATRPRLSLYLVLVLGSILISIFALVSLLAGIFQVPQPGAVSVIALLAILAILVLTIRPLVRSPTRDLAVGIKPLALTICAGALALSSQGLVNLFTLGFFSASTVTFSDSVRTYMTRNGLFVATAPDIPWSIVSLLLSGVFFGWGLYFTVRGLHSRRRDPVVIFFLAALPLFLAIQSLDRNYFRYELFMGALIALFLAIGLIRFFDRSALFLALFASIVTLSLRYIIVLPSLDHEHRVFPDIWQVPLQIALVSPIILRSLRLTLRGRSLRSVPSFNLKFIPKPSYGTLRRITRSRAVCAIMLVLAFGLLAANIMTIRYTNEIYTPDETLLNQSVLPLIEEKSRVLTVERVHRSFHFYKDVEVVELWQPWPLEGFLQQRINDTSGLISWLKLNLINYVFLDLQYVEENLDVYQAFERLTQCTEPMGCIIRYDDTRFILLEVVTF